MCGIAGILNFDGAPVDENILRKMSAIIRHRGPDDKGFYFGAEVGLASRRLSVIDLGGGHQPMSNEDKGLWIVFNGEIYNYLELRKSLIAQGHVFKTESDTEVILHLFEEYGVDCVHKLNGMFAFALWDERAKNLFLARDRFGIKPLYYHINDLFFCFASEVKALLQIPRVGPKVNPEAVKEYFTFQNFLTEATIFKDIFLLPPGSFILCNLENTIVKRCYWDPTFEYGQDMTESEWEERTQKYFEDAVGRHLNSDVPLGSFLSGGMDSGSIVAIASRKIPRLMTFTAGFDMSSVSGLEIVFDEREEAEFISNYCSTEHYEMIIHHGDMAWILPKLIWHLEEPRVGMSYQNYYVARLASKFVKVVLSGTGGDELFAGYPWRYRLVSNLDDGDDFNKIYYDYWTRLIKDEESGDFFSSDFLEPIKSYSTFDIFLDVINNVKSLAPVEKALYFEMKTFLHGLLVIEDKITMANSLESRLPFLDRELVGLVLKMPYGLKFTQEVGKYIFRHAARKYLPDRITAAKKQGFSPPDESWYRSSTMDYIRDILLSKRALEREYFNPHYIRNILEEHQSAKRNHRLLIWSLLSFEWWNRIFVDGEYKGLIN